MTDAAQLVQPEGSHTRLREVLRHSCLSVQGIPHATVATRSEVVAAAAQHCPAVATIADSQTKPGELDAGPGVSYMLGCS